MVLLQNLREAMDSLSANKLRSILTVLGIVIGVAAVIAMLSIGRGARQQITDQIESIGTNLIYVTPGSTNQRGVFTAAGSAGTLTVNDASALMNVPGVVAVTAETEGRVQAAYLGQNVNTRLIGTTPNYMDVHSLSLADGSFISDSNQAARSAVVVLGSNVAQNLFGSTAGVVGQNVRLNGQPYRVIGVLNSTGGTGFLNQDDQVIVPITTAQTRLANQGRFRGGNVINQITVKATSASQVPTVVTAVTEEMRALHNTTAATDDFTVTSQQATIGAATERTREIGLRKALGARRRDILTQFLVESTVLSFIGGVIGVIGGWSIARLLGQIQLGSSAITPVVGLDSVLLATLFSMAVGLFFGIYPATRAARMLPVEALRYE